jgi:hypothetical protein
MIDARIPRGCGLIMSTEALQNMLLERTRRYVGALSFAGSFGYALPLNRGRGGRVDA